MTLLKMQNGVAMKKTYFKIISILMVMMFVLSGCGTQMPDLTGEEEQMVGEFAANLLLRYDANNRSRLISREEVEQELLERQQWQELLESIKKEEGMRPVEDTPTVEIGEETAGGVYGSAEEFFAMSSGVKVAYQGYKVCDSYPESEADFFALDATEGKRLVVLQFTLSNNSGREQEVDILKQNPVNKLTINGTYNTNMLTTLLLDDMSTYRGTLANGESVQLVLLAEVDDDVANGISSMILRMKDSTNSCAIQLQ